MTPPPTDEQQEMQQKMMKWMMVFMGLMFYKVAAGLCIYFIASSLWGLAERKLLPKAKKPDPNQDIESQAQEALALDRAKSAGSQGITTRPAAANSTNITARKPGRNKRKDRIKAKDEPPPSGIGKLRQRLSDWWNDVLEQARKK
jgi:membrane protein insertase Oxa1/YidC/SpoIIIJ